LEVVEKVVLDGTSSALTRYVFSSASSEAQRLAMKSASATESTAGVPDAAPVGPWMALEPNDPD